MIQRPSARDIAHFRAFGFVVLRGALDADKLGAEVDLALEAAADAPLATGVARTQYVPMMVASTPYSVSLLDRFEVLAAALLGGPVVPLRAKGVRTWYRPDNAVLKLGTTEYAIDLVHCKGCGLCAEECPCGAIEMVPEAT